MEKLEAGGSLEKLEEEEAKVGSGKFVRRGEI